MRIANARLIAGQLGLDTQGFCLARHDTAVRNILDKEELKTVYYPEMERLVCQVSGASRAVLFDHTIRHGDQATREEKLLREPVFYVHNDYTENSAPRRVRDFLGDAEAEKRFKKRWAIIQVWRPIRGDVLVDPLAMCDGRSIPQKGFIRVERRYKDRTGEVYHIAHNPAHVWFYFPRMTRNEALVFKVFDSDTSKASRFTAHSAFDDPTSPPNAPPRESIETRCFAFFD